jgi:uncharacterized repeat protein (TIGR03803 family)
MRYPSVKSIGSACRFAAILSALSSKSKRLFPRKSWWGIGTMFAFALLGAGQVASAQGTPYEVIHDFTGSDGGYPWGSLILSASGNLYGETALGNKTNEKCGEDGCGTVFELSKNPAGGWKRTVLHAFSGSDGFDPSGGLVFDGAGNLYGVTIHGGLYNAGVLFELSPGSGGGWMLTLLHNFGGPGDGASAWGRPVFDGGGNLYGTAVTGGASGSGVVYELSPTLTGTWNETLIYNFTGGLDGGNPYSGLVFDGAGNLYGTTGAGGHSTVHVCKINAGCGVVFELSPNSSGGWSETVLHDFNGYDGWHSGDLIFDQSGNLYSTTSNGGDFSGCASFGCGVVYELSPNADSGWTETVLHVFQPGPQNYGGSGGSTPVGVALDAAGNLYGTTFYGANYSPGCSLGLAGCGVVFKLSPKSTGGWKETVLHTFTGGADGANPQSGVTIDPAGKLFGTGVSGPTDSACVTLGGCGVVFEIKP